MVKEITGALLAVLIVGGSVYAVLSNNVEAVKYLAGISGAVIGYYFGKYQPSLSAVFGKKTK